MKKIVFLLFFFLSCEIVSAASWPSPIGYVNDFAHVIAPAQSHAMESLLSNLEEKTGVQIAVVTVPTVEGADINGAAVDLFKAWGIGKKGKDNGILFLAAIEDHKARIELGYGLEGAVTDGQAGEILRRDMIPLFKQGDYSQALTNGVQSVIQLLEKSMGKDLGAGQLTNSGSQTGSAPPDWVVVLIIFLAVLVIVYLANQVNKKFPGRRGGGFYGGGWGSGGGGFSGGGSGFGGFGGGSSGGGGASGSW